jgi:hypothetical protein
MLATQTTHHLRLALLALLLPDQVPKPWDELVVMLEDMKGRVGMDVPHPKLDCTLKAVIVPSIFTCLVETPTVDEHQVPTWKTCSRLTAMDLGKDTEFSVQKQNLGINAVVAYYRGGPQAGWALVSGFWMHALLAVYVV